MKTATKNFVLEQERAQTTPLIKNLLWKRKLLAEGNPDHATIRTALLVMGGGMRGVYGAGVVTGLEKAGFHDVFDLTAGVSAGAADIHCERCRASSNLRIRAPSAAQGLLASIC